MNDKENFKASGSTNLSNATVKPDPPTEHGMCDNYDTVGIGTKNTTDHGHLGTESVFLNSSTQNASTAVDSDTKACIKSDGNCYKSQETPTNDQNNILSVLDSGIFVGRDKKPSEGDSVGSYDTHSDSIETLEGGSREDISNDLSDVLVRQISLTSQGDLPSRYEAGKEDDIDIITTRPDSLSLPRRNPKFERIRSTSDAELRPPKNISSEPERPRTQSDIIEIATSYKHTDNFNSDNNLSQSLPHGSIIRKGEMIEFVAEDLQEKIRRSSPISRTDSSSYSSRRSSLRSVSSSTSASTSMATSSGFSRSPSSLFQQSPDDLPPIDPQALFDLENQALLVADSIDLMMGNLKSNLHKMSSITIGCLDAYRHSVESTCESVDGSIKSMYALMAKCEELSKNMQPIYKLAEKIKEIKRLLDLFEGQLTEKT